MRRGRKSLYQIDELAERVGLTHTTIYRYLQGKAQCPPKLATELEEITNVNRLAWIYPLEYDNPYHIRIEEKHARAQAAMHAPRHRRTKAEIKAAREAGKK